MQTKIFSAVSHKLTSALVLTAMLLAALPVLPAFAADITVTTATDEFTPTGTVCSLREAIVLANNNGTSANDCTRSGVGNDDIITLQSGVTYTLSIAGAGGATVGDLNIGNATGTSGNLTIQASGSTPATIDANDIDRVLNVGAAGNPSLTLINIIVTNGNTTGQSTTTGGGIRFDGTGTLTLTNSSVTSNVATNAAGCGGGIYNNTAATVVITNSTIDSNTCATAGSDGGGLFKGTGGTLTITNSTISNNSAADNGGGAIFTGGTITIANSTVANNTAGTKGGGIQVNGATVTVEFSTFSGNTANDIVSNTGGGAIQANAGSVAVSTSILANSTTISPVDVDCDKSGTGSVTLTNSLVENKNDCSGTPTSTADPALGPLTNNGGNTDTMAIGDTSPAYNAATSCGLFTTDQRGFTRPQSLFCDLGAYELQNPIAPTVVSVVRASSDPTTANNVNYTVTFSESVSGVDTTDFTITPTDTAAGSVNTVSAGPSATYTVNVNAVSGNGTIRLDVLDDDTILDVDTNSLDGSFNAGEIYTVDNIIPTVLSITRADDTNPTNTATVDFSVVFSEAVSGVGTGDFIPTITTGAITGASISTVNGVGNTYTVTVNTGSGDGTIRLDLKGSGTGITDLATNPISGGFTTGEDYTVIKSAPFANVQVRFAGVLQNTYSIAPQYSTRQSYVGVKSGPVKVSGNLPIVASERMAYSPDGGTTWTSYSETMGLASNQLAASYSFPYYDNTTTITSQLRFANLGAVSTNVTVRIGNLTKGPYTLAPNTVKLVSYAGLKGGPVQVSSSGGVPIVASLRLSYNNGSAVTSSSEMMGLPAKKLATTYLFPYYNSKTNIGSQLRIANVGPTSTTVTVSIHGVVKGTYTLAPKAVQLATYPNVSNGPLKVTSSGGVKILASLYSSYKANSTTFTDASELMGQPATSLSTRFSFPSYDSVHHNSQLRIVNVGGAQTTVTITINGVLMSTFPLLPNAVKLVSFPGLDTGPVVIQSSGNVSILASKRVQYSATPPVITSFSEMMGLPLSQLVKIYYFPLYDNLTIDSQLRFAVP